QAGGNVAFGQRGRDAQGAGERIEVGQRRRILRLQLLLQRGQVDAAGVELYVELHGTSSVTVTAMADGPASMCAGPAARLDLGQSWGAGSAARDPDQVRSKSGHFVHSLPYRRSEEHTSELQSR